MTLDPGADISDVYAFTSYDAANLARPAEDRAVTLIMNVVPSQEPSSGPNYFAFDDNVLYQLHVDNDRDGAAEDLVYEFQFETETRTPDQFIARFNGTAIFAAGTHVNGMPAKNLVDVVAAWNAVNDPDLTTEVGWTPTLFEVIQPTKDVPSDVQNDAGPFIW